MKVSPNVSCRSTMVLWSAVIFLLDSKSSIQRGAQNVAWKEKYRTEQPKISIFLPALKELVMKIYNSNCLLLHFGIKVSKLNCSRIVFCWIKNLAMGTLLPLVWFTENKNTKLKKTQRNNLKVLLGLWYSLISKCAFVCFYFSFVIFKPQPRPSC